MDGSGRSLSAHDSSVNTRSSIAKGSQYRTHGYHSYGWTFPPTLREAGPVRSDIRWNMTFTSITSLSSWNQSGMTALR